MEANLRKRLADKWIEQHGGWEKMDKQDGEAIQKILHGSPDEINKLFNDD